MHDLCVLRDEGGLADVFAARVTSRKVTVALDAFGAAGAPAAAGAPGAAGTTGGAGTLISNRTGWLNVGGGPARSDPLGPHSPPATRAASAASIASAASAAAAVTVDGGAGRCQTHAYVRRRDGQDPLGQHQARLLSGPLRLNLCSSLTDP